MVKLVASQAAWGQDDFTRVLQNELEALGPDGLSLARSATISGHFADDISVMILSLSSSNSTIEANIGVLYTEIEPAYCCPMIPMEHSGMCKMRVLIDKNTALSEFNLLDD
ncbi:hypothetical protein [Plesiomonas sp.]|uniref:hypothetical protein n=1 Tax=Plesiomonas sp. TaxID=2486279 RepID=UPI003F2AFC70